jgi:hypothetical protein
LIKLSSEVTAEGDEKRTPAAQSAAFW